MRLVVTEFISMDGVIEGPGGEKDYKHSGWTIPYWTMRLARSSCRRCWLAMHSFWAGSLTRGSLLPGRPEQMNKGLQIE